MGDGDREEPLEKWDGAREAMVTSGIGWTIGIERDTGCHEPPIDRGCADSGAGDDAVVTESGSGSEPRWRGGWRERVKGRICGWSGV